jgi:hypothetical protein
LSKNVRQLPDIFKSRFEKAELSWSLTHNPDQTYCPVEYVEDRADEQTMAGLLPIVGPLERAERRIVLADALAFAGDPLLGPCLDWNTGL